MRNNSKKLGAILLIGAMTMTLLAGCGNNATSTADDDATAKNETTVNTEAGKSEFAGESITLLNSKGEIQTALEEAAKTFESETGIHLEVLACGTGEVPYTKVTSMYNSGTAPTMAILDTTDVISLGEEYCVDLTKEDWVQYCEAMVTKVNDKIYSFPFCVEGRGIIYNKAAIEETLGTSFDPATINSADSFKALCQSLRENGMENPIVLSKEDWSLGAHDFGYVYDTKDGTTDGAMDVIEKLKSGEQDIAKYDRYTQFMDMMDIVLEYNFNKKDPLGALYDEDPMHLVDKEAAFWLNGNWAWPNIESAGASTSDEYGFLPFFMGNDTKDFANNAMQASPTKQLIVDKKQASDKQQKAALAFINWLVNSESGQKALVEKCALIPACKNNTVAPKDPLSKDIVAKMNAGKTYASSFVAPSDHWSVVGAIMQKYVGGQLDKAGVATEVANYWKSQK